MEAIKFDRDGLVPVVAQDAATGEVLMLAYMTADALRKTAQTQEAWYWSRSRQTLWRKGETSGHTQRVQEIRVDCDDDAILLRVQPDGPACHTGHPSCFFRGLDGRDAPRAAGIFSALYELIKTRKDTMPVGSYTVSLLAQGREAIAAKVREESDELICAAREESDQRLVEEAADLIYHTWVLLADRGVELHAVEQELVRRRHGR